MHALPFIDRAAALLRVAQVLQANPQLSDYQELSLPDMLAALQQAALDCLDSARAALREGVAE